MFWFALFTLSCCSTNSFANAAPAEVHQYLEDMSLWGATMQEKNKQLRRTNQGLLRAVSRLSAERAVGSNTMYYPDFGGSKNICVTGGGQPDYMNNAPSVWMHATLKACCSTNYQYNYNECVGSDPSAAAASGTTTGTGLYYPDWSAEYQGCKNDNKEPSYMNVNPTYYMSSTLEACCEKYFSHAKEGCLSFHSAAAASGTTTVTGLYYPAGDDLWYKRSTDWVCVQDCTLANGDCGGVRNSWETSTYVTRAKCCASIDYDTDCNTRFVSPL